MTNDKQTELDETHFKVISQWEHYAFLSLLETDDFEFDLDWISKRLGISKLRVEQVIDHLVGLKLIEKNNQTITKNFSSLKTSEDIQSQAIQKSHEETVHMAIEKLKELEPIWRDFSSITMTMDPDQIPEAKKLIREFRKKFSLLMESGKKKEVYRLQLMFYPLTQIDADQKK